MEALPQFKLPATASEIQETLQDGAHLRVTFLDQSRAPELVKIRRVPRSGFVAYADIIMRATTNEAPEVAFYAEKQEAWADDLSDESFEAVIQEGRRLNFTRFQSWFGRRQEVLGLAKISAPGVAQIAEAVKRVMAEKPT